MGFLLLGIDSLIACVAIGAIVDRGSRLRLAALFGVADGVGFLIAAGLGLRISGNLSAVLQTGILVALGLYLYVVAAGTRQVAAHWPVWAAVGADARQPRLWPRRRPLGRYAPPAGWRAGVVERAPRHDRAPRGCRARAPAPRGAATRRATANRVAGGALVLAAGGFALLG